MEALIRAARTPDFPAEIVSVISDKADAGGLAKAQAAGIATQVFTRKDYASKDAHEDAILDALAALNPDIVCLAGYMRLLSGKFIKPYEGASSISTLPCYRFSRPAHASACARCRYETGRLHRTSGDGRHG